MRHWPGNGYRPVHPENGLGAKAGEAAVLAGLILVVLGAVIIYQTAADGKLI
jgi:hypothetical protein